MSQLHCLFLIKHFTFLIKYFHEKKKTFCKASFLVFQAKIETINNGTWKIFQKKKPVRVKILSKWTFNKNFQWWISYGIMYLLGFDTINQTWPYVNEIYFKCPFRSAKNSFNHSPGYLQEKFLEKKYSSSKKK